ncbi:dual specificity protein phosphatase family protein [Halohasta salina]|uniref:dual specificity protein phosphatase family protein n=1 Tax=Halohasta salina TaxID=2961621 RepID=UPI0020A3A6EB|nr:dual specificity protein phosphatase [Halohasta salina]
MDEITENLYISKALALLELPADHEFDEVVSLSSRDHLGIESPKPTTTGDQFVFPDGPHDYEIFEAAVDYTIECLDRGDKTLVHCQAGVSRSAGVCTAAIAVRQGLDADQAREKIKASRPEINPTSEIWKSTVRYVDEHTRLC